MANRPTIQKTLDLTVAGTQVEIVPPNFPIQQIFVSQLPAGAVFAIRTGRDDAPVPQFQGASRIFAGDPLTVGVYADWTAQPGLVAVVSMIVGAYK